MRTLLRMACWRILVPITAMWLPFAASSEEAASKLCAVTIREGDGAVRFAKEVPTRITTSCTKGDVLAVTGNEAYSPLSTIPLVCDYTRQIVVGRNSFSCECAGERSMK
jgi:hypothetical protein